MLSAGYA